MKFKIKNLNTLRPQKGKVSKRANVLLHHFLQNRSSLFPPSLWPQKTSDSTKWATCILSDWFNEINGCPSALLDCPTDLFKHVKVTNGNRGYHYGHPLSTLDFWLAGFVTEVRKADRGYYSPVSLNELLSDF